MSLYTDFINYINKNGGEVYVVGGFIRTIVYNKIHNTNISTKDIDFLVRDVEEDRLIFLLEMCGKVKKVGSSFGVLILKPFDSEELYEIALPRKETSLGCEYRNFDIEIDPNLPIEKELERRDFTINAMCMQVYNMNDVNNLNLDFDLNNVIDVFNGKYHIENKICCCVNDPYDRFKDDPTRILRAFRISTQLNLEIEENTLIAIKQHANLLNMLIPKSSVRLYNELFKIIKYNSYYNNLEIMHNFNILNVMGILTNIETLKLIENTNIYVVKVMIILKECTPSMNFKKWCDIFQISAVDGISKDDIILLETSHDDTIMCLLRDLKTKYNMLCLLKKLNCYSQNPLNLLFHLIEYLNVIDTINKKLLSDLFDECRAYPFSVANIKITGHEIKNITGKTGKDIGTIKDEILNDIFNDVVNNDSEVLKEHILKEKFL